MRTNTYVCGLVAESCPTLVTTWTVACLALHRIFHAGILEWVAVSFSKHIRMEPKKLYLWTYLQGSHRNADLENRLGPRLKGRRWDKLRERYLNLLITWETWVWSLSSENLLEKGTTTHSNILAQRIPGPEEPDGLQSMGSQLSNLENHLVRHYWATHSLTYIQQIANGKLLYNTRSSTWFWAVGWCVCWEEGSRRRVHRYSYGWFMLYGRNQHNIVKQLLSN